MLRFKGENQIKWFKKIAEDVIRQIPRHKEVTGIVLTGGLVRGFTDRYSDIDITVFLHGKNESLRKKIIKISSAEQKRFGVDIDLEVHSLEQFRRRRWSETDKWDFSQTEIVFDPDEQIRRLLANKTRVSNSFWKDRIIIYGEYLKWYCCPLTQDVGTVVDSWIERGDLLSVQYCLSYALDLMIGIIFALNKQFLPPLKWRIYYSYRLEWLPTNYRKLVKEALTVRSPSIRDVNRRMKALRQMWIETVPVIQAKTGLTQQLISKGYREKILSRT